MARTRRSSLRLQVVVRQGQPHLRSAPTAARDRGGPRDPRRSATRSRRAGADRRPRRRAGEPVAEVVDVLQTPAFLCRQTDFIIAVAARASRSMSRRGSSSPRGNGAVVEKARSGGNSSVLVTRARAQLRLSTISCPTCDRSRSCALRLSRSSSMPRTACSCREGRARRRAASASSCRPWPAPRRRRGRRALHGGPRGSRTGAQRRAEHGPLADLPSRCSRELLVDRRGREEPVRQGDGRAAALAARPRASTAVERARRVLEIEADAVRRRSRERLGAELELAVELLAATAGKVIVTGLGKSGTSPGRSPRRSRARERRHSSCTRERACTAISAPS